MKESLVTGLETTRRYTIDEERTIGFMGDECRVYSTPRLLHDIETVCRDLLLEHADSGEDSVGTQVKLDHTGATLLGMWIELTARVTEVNGRAVKFEFSARDALEQVASGWHSRFVVDLETTARRLKAKLAKVQEL